jgi:hypothetical protein
MCCGSKCQAVDADDDGGIKQMPSKVVRLALEYNLARLHLVIHFRRDFLDFDIPQLLVRLSVLHKQSKGSPSDSISVSIDSLYRDVLQLEPHTSHATASFSMDCFRHSPRHPTNPKVHHNAYQKSFH